MNNGTKISTLLLVAALLGTAPSFAQPAKDKDVKNRQQEIIIRKNGDKVDKTTIVIEGDKVTINGKPLDEYKNGDVTVMRRDGATNITHGATGYGRGNSQAFSLDNMGFARGNKALLGVVTEKSDNGAKVTEVNKESAAQKAGLAKDDVITRVGDTKIETPADLMDAVSKYKPNDKVDIWYKRDNKESKTSVTLGENKTRSYAFNFDNNDLGFSMPSVPTPPMFSFNRKPKIGLQIKDLEEGKGVSVNDVDEDSPAAKAGFKEGDVITEVNGKEIAGVDELRNEIKDVKEGDTVKMKYKRGSSAQTAEIKIPKKLKTADL